MLVTLVLLLGLADGPGPTPGGDPEPPPAVDCGTSSLYTLMRLEKRGVPLESLRERLEGGVKRDHSLGEIKEAARSFGLRLEGVRLASGDRAPDRPALVYLDREPHGHFVVVQPVGHSGKLVQVLDPGLEPEVLDAAALYARPEWTGLALIPGRLNHSLLFSILCASLALAMLGASWVGRRRRGR